MEIEDIVCGFVEEVDYVVVLFVREEVVLFGF